MTFIMFMIMIMFIILVLVIIAILVIQPPFLGTKQFSREMSIWNQGQTDSDVSEISTSSFIWPCKS